MCFSASCNPITRNCCQIKMTGTQMRLTARPAWERPPFLLSFPLTGHVGESCNLRVGEKVNCKQKMISLSAGVKIKYFPFCSTVKLSNTYLHT